MLPSFVVLVLLKTRMIRRINWQRLHQKKLFSKNRNLLKEAKKIMGHILIDDADVLIVDQIGKNISGDGMDPNVSGTLPRETGVPRGEDGSDPKISNFHANRVIVLDLNGRNARQWEWIRISRYHYKTLCG